jgi:hypothetical protein
MPYVSTRVVLAGASALVLLLPLQFPPASGDDDPAPVIPREAMDDPPAPFGARDDVLARSPAFRATVGSYTSIQVNVDEFGQNILGDAANEPSIAVHPSHPVNMVIGWRQFDTIASNFRQAGYGFTVDGGQSWTFPGVLTPGTFRSDPVLDFDSRGDLYYHSLKQTFDVDVFTSVDGGQSWGPPVFAFGGDKNWMVVDRSGGIGDGHIYGIWQAVAGCCGQSIFNRSTDGGQSFESPVPVAGSPGIGTMAVGPDGEVYAAGIDETFGQNMSTFVVAKSTNAQNPAATPTFTATEVELHASMGFGFGPNPGGLLGQVNVAVDHSQGPSRGYVYVLASVDPDQSGQGPIDVHFSRSTDGGATWSPPLRVNDDPPGGTTYHWLGALSVAPNGRLDAIWADTRNSGQVNVSELFYSYSWDQGNTWSPNAPVSPPFDSFVGWPQQNKIGDYYTIISDGTGADAAYAATFNGEQDVYSIRLFPDCNGNGQSDVVDVATSSADCNLNMIPDECEEDVDCGAAGAVADGKTVPGTPLAIEKVAGSDIRLTWSASCLIGDTDYGVYEGNLGSFTSHTPRLCTTGGETAVDLVPATASSYYLIVPRNQTHEGSYGRNGDLVARPQGPIACAPQEAGSCPGLPSD